MTSKLNPTKTLYLKKK